ncbi:hypothetical protein BDY21DRAFT_15426 [Lineolata rhizophorae]|uniref:Uncharacterized protein n=1 Tax=Lineolata rhizophorae TaxID=578093 RepID=A0A6A6P1S7_9PEZI|nr:hypothetical protein BDY21DRAFT_15426 [Lineolata rhizophorae]
MADGSWLADDPMEWSEDDYSSLFCSRNVLGYDAGTTGNHSHHEAMPNSFEQPLAIDPSTLYPPGLDASNRQASFGAPSQNNDSTIAHSDRSRTMPGNNINTRETGNLALAQSIPSNLDDLPSNAFRFENDSSPGPNDPTLASNLPPQSTTVQFWDQLMEPSNVSTTNNHPNSRIFRAGPDSGLSGTFHRNSFLSSPKGNLDTLDPFAFVPVVGWRESSTSAIDLQFQENSACFSVSQPLDQSLLVASRPPFFPQQQSLALNSYPLLSFPTSHWTSVGTLAYPYNSIASPRQPSMSIPNAPEEIPQDMVSYPLLGLPGINMDPLQNQNIGGPQTSENLIADSNVPDRSVPSLGEETEADARQNPISTAQQRCSSQGTSRRIEDENRPKRTLGTKETFAVRKFHKTQHGGGFGLFVLANRPQRASRPRSPQENENRKKLKEVGGACLLCKWDGKRMCDIIYSYIPKRNILLLRTVGW